MRRLLTVIACTIFLTAGLAGCLGKDEPAPAAVDPVDVTPEAPPVDDGRQPMSDDVGHQPHIHDYWNGRERVTLMEETISMEPFSVLAFTFFNSFQGTPGVGGVAFQLPDGAIVYEGTGVLDFTASWSDATITGMGLRYRSADSPSWSEPIAIEPDVAVSIDVSPSMSDMPHAETSRWAFMLVPTQAGQSAAGNIEVRIDIVRMHDIEMFPGHPMLFEGANQVVLFSGEGKSAQSNVALEIAGFVTGSSVDQSIRSQRVVPMETLSMSANITVLGSSATVGEVANIYLFISPADTNGWMRAPLLYSDKTSGEYTFAWTVDMRQTDSPYADESDWRFLVRSTSEVVEGMECGGCGDVEVDFRMDVVAYDGVYEGAVPPMSGRGN